MTRIHGRTMATCLLALAVVAVSASPAAGEVVLEWNQIALAATVTAGQGPNPQTRTLAIVHVAMHDAVNAITGKYRLYSPRGPAPLGASPEAAVIAAAHGSLRGLFAAQGASLDAARQASLAARALSETDPGIALGESIAAAILAQRAADNASVAAFPYTAPDAGSPGVWVPVGGAPPVLPGWGKVTPWVLRTATQFKPGRPYRLESKPYAADYDEVRQVGARVGSSRTGTQDEIARFWLGTPSAIWNGVARQVIATRQLSDSTAAQVLAHFYLAAADAGIATWEAKYRLNYWRPFTAIRNGHEDDNHRTEPDPMWEAFLTTPQHPEFPSGHATNSGAMATVLILAFGDKPGIPIVATSPTNPALSRTWTRFSEGIAEVVDARIYSGFHFRRAMDAGARLGARVANYVVKHSLEPREHR